MFEDKRKGGTPEGEGPSLPPRPELPIARREIRPGLEVGAVKEGAEIIAADGLRVCTEIFKDADITERLSGTYQKLLKGNPIEPTTAEDPVQGELEWSLFTVYYHEGEPVAIGGLYRYLAKPEEAWLGRFGVTDAARGTGLAAEIFHSLESDARALGANRLLAFTEPENVGAIRFYEKHGMKRVPLDVGYFGEETLVLGKSLD